MGEMRQSPVERQRLIDIWHAHPSVIQLRADAEAFAQGLRYDQEGMTAVLRFAAAFIATHEWPETGILIG